MTLIPVLFIGHGSPMNALDHNPFTESLRHLGESLPKPQAILCVSAHWETQGTQVLHNATPPTIHDFYGFPQSLFEFQYPAPMSPSFRSASMSAKHPNSIYTWDDTCAPYVSREF